MTSGESLAFMDPDRSGRNQTPENNPPGIGSNSVLAQSPLARLQTALQSRLIATITVSILLSLGLTGTSAWNIWRIYQGLQTTVAKQFKLQELSGNIVHLDEVLTMSARMAASTGNPKWESRYNEYVPQLDADIKAILQDVPASQQSNPGQTDAANQKLVAMETKAFELVRQSKAPQALNLLLGPNYEAQKKIYSSGIQGTLNTVKQNVEAQLSAYRQNLLWSVLFAVSSALLLALSWAVVLLAVKGYIRERQESQKALLSSQENLMQTNQALEHEAQERLRQEEQIRQESELLQDDVAHILDVVTALEEGDLTIEADVSERATGLVSDTLNRLTESLNRIISVVVSTAQQVTHSAEELQDLAVDTAEQAKAQTLSAQDVQSLMISVSTLTDSSRQQAIATEVAVTQAQAAVASGQQEMSAMVGGIDTLQQGTGQIVKRTELLSDFVELAAQFSKDQKRIASLTRVLALNASTLSTRALREQDPEQFASIANEFEAVARQVTNLANETNRSLVLLQQRTDQIQTVTSGLNQDVSDISKLVQDFTTGVNQSRLAFDNIQAVTEQVAQVGQQVSQSSAEIVREVRQTFVATEAIATAAQSTEAKASVTRQQVETMGNLAQTLLEMVEFFRISSVAAQASSEPADSVLEPLHLSAAGSRTELKSVVASAR
jgi:methyl-accepting chemotaxis protein PixJ